MSDVSEYCEIADVPNNTNNTTDTTDTTEPTGSGVAEGNDSFNYDNANEYNQESEGDDNDYGYKPFEKASV